MLSHLKTDTKAFSIPEKDNPVEPFLIRYSVVKTMLRGWLQKLTQVGF